MPTGQCEVTPPASPTSVDGRDVYRCSGGATVDNDQDQDIYYNVSLVISDSQGHTAQFNQPNLSAAANDRSTSGPFFVDLAADLYTSGDIITFECHMNLTAAVSVSEHAANTVTVP